MIIRQILLKGGGKNLGGQSASRPGGRDLPQGAAQRSGWLKYNELERILRDEDEKVER